MTDLIEKINQIGTKALSSMEQIQALDALEAFRIEFMGKKGALSEVLRTLGSLDPEARKQVGAKANEWKSKVESHYEKKQTELQAQALSQKLSQEKIDITLPARQLSHGSLHPVTTVTRKLVQVFSTLGFEQAIGPEVETEYMNFEAANIPADHPARDMQDTFFMNPGVVLRTHTTAIQMRTMLERKWPLRVICSGAVYRSDSDATHIPMFHQMEGLWVDRNVKMSDLKGILSAFAKQVFGTETKVRLRPSYFPFVEPGAEVDVSCFNCGKNPKNSCRICKGSGWLEILGAGMVHPKLFEIAGFGDAPEKENLTGFAFGLGIERIAMLLHHLPDLRALYQGDVRLLSQFGGLG